MPLEAREHQYWIAAVGYVELGMFQEANDQLETLIRLIALPLKKAFEINSTWRLHALDDEELRRYGIRCNLLVVRADEKLTTFFELELATRGLPPSHL